VLEPQFETARRHFDAKEYFEAHEVWEEMWNEAGGARHSFLQGLIQAAAYLLHIQRKDGGGADLYHASFEKLKSFQQGYWGADIQKLLEALQGVRDKNERDEETTQYPTLNLLKKSRRSDEI